VAKPTWREQIPVIPLLVFAAIDLLVAFLMVATGGFSWAFALIATIGVGLAGLGLWGLYHMPGPDEG
jgi:hypothetical protein